MPGPNSRGPLLSLVGVARDVAFYLREVEARAGPALVLGAANGRIAWELARAGVQTVAVDPSERMIEAAAERRGAEPLEVSERLELRHADLRALRLEARFKVVLAPQNALGLMTHLDDLDALLATVRHHLAPGGALLFDVRNPPPDPLEAPPPDWSPQEGVEPPRPLFAPHLRERRRDVAKGEVEEGIRRLKLRHFSAAELDRALEEADFAATERYGGFDGKPFDPADPVQVVVAIRREG